MKFSLFRVPSKSRRPLALLLIGLIGLVAIQVSGQGRSRLTPELNWQPISLSNGSPVLFEVKAPAKLQAVSAAWMGHSLSFAYSAADKVWYGLGGISLTTASGTYDLRVTETFANGRTAEVVRKIKIVGATYPQITVKVAKQYTEPSQEQLTAISADKGVKAKVFEAVSAKRLWAGRFVAP